MKNLMELLEGRSRKRSLSSVVMRKQLEKALGGREEHAERDRAINDQCPDYERSAVVDARIVPLLKKLADAQVQIGHAMIAVREAEEALEAIESECDDLQKDVFEAVHAFMGVPQETEFVVTGHDEKAKLYVFSEAATKARKLKAVKDMLPSGAFKSMPKELRDVLARKAGVDPKELLALDDDGDDDNDANPKIGFTTH